MLPEQVWSLGSSVSESTRDPLVRFWLAVPSDQVQALWSSPFGHASAALIKALTPEMAFTQDQVNLRNLINQRLTQTGLQHPLAPQLLVAVFLYSPPGLMEIANPDQNLPAWLSSVYQDLYVSSTVNTSTGLNNNQQEAQTPLPQASDSEVPAPPQFGPFPSSLQELNANRIHLNRILGLSNLYYIDPDDKEILSELLDVRSGLADLIFKAETNTLQDLWQADFGDRYWAMVRSGVQKEPLNEKDQERKDKATKILNPSLGGGFNHPEGVNAFLVAMLYYAPGTMQVEGAKDKLPQWLYPHYEQIFLAALNQQNA